MISIMLLDQPELETENRLLSYLAQNRFAIKQILTGNRPDYNKIISLLNSGSGNIFGSNNMYNTTLINYILETPLADVPSGLIEALGKSTINEDQCRDAIQRFCKSIADKKGIFWITENKRYYQKLSGGKTLISSDGRFLLPNQLERILIQKVYILYTELKNSNVINEDLLNEINSFTKGFLQVKVVDGIIVFLLSNDTIGGSIENIHNIKVNNRATNEDNTIPKLLAHLIYQHMPQDIKRLVEGEKLPILTNEQEHIISNIIHKDYDPRKIQETLLNEIQQS